MQIQFHPIAAAPAHPVDQQPDDSPLGSGVHDRDGAVPHLFLHVDGALALLEQQTGEGVAQIMESNLS